MSNKSQSLLVLLIYDFKYRGKIIHNGYFILGEKSGYQILCEANPSRIKTQKTVSAAIALGSCL